MAIGDPTYGTPVTLPNLARLHSLADGEARTFGEVDNETANGLKQNISLFVEITASSVASYDLYMVESTDGAVWTDDIDPTADTGDVIDKIFDAKLITSMSTIYSSPERISISINFTVDMLSSARFIGFVFVNNTGQTTPSSNAAGESIDYKVSAA